LTDIVRVKDEYYVRASSALADDRTRVLKYGDTFAVFNRYGDIEAFGPSQFGLFHAESRHLSRFTMRVNQQQPLLLSSTIREDNSFLSVDLVGEQLVAVKSVARAYNEMQSGEGQAEKPEGSGIARENATRVGRIVHKGLAREDGFFHCSISFVVDEGTPRKRKRQRLDNFRSAISSAP
jgi:hypothetical protein